jgi:transglutaminase/protease-like cytokinesis protein 3
MKKICLALALVLCLAFFVSCNKEKPNGDIVSNYTSSSIAQSEGNVTDTASSEIAKTETSSISSTASEFAQSQTASQNINSNLVSKLPSVSSKPTLEEIDITNSQKAQDIILKTTNPAMTDIEKIKATYKWLYPNFKYRTASVDLSNGFTKELETELASYYFRYHKGSCEHYAAAQKAMINQLGYECMYVTGERYSSLSRRWGEHTWLIVKVGESWYHVDGLFGGLFYNVIETTFMVPDSALEKTHRWNRESYPACTNAQLLK